MQCVHLNRVGEQCRGQAVAGSQLCAYHAGILEGRSSAALDGGRESGTARRPRIPLVFRVAAGLLLLGFVLEFVQVIRGWFL